MSNILDLAVGACFSYKVAFCKFVSADDVDEAGSEEPGISIPQKASKILFEPFRKGEKKEKLVKITWQGDFETVGRLCVKGKSTGYRITGFGHDFPYLKQDDVGDLFILVKADADKYLGFFLSKDEEIDDFLAYFNMSPVQTNDLIPKGNH